jgi:hypothetical protein
MGLFDWVKCEYTLPDGFQPPGEYDDFQTKTFDDPYMEHYAITREGRLLHRFVCYDITPAEERHRADQWEDTGFHGDLEFGTYNTETKEEHQYIARFTGGRLSWIHLHGASDSWPGSMPI